MADELSKDLVRNILLITLIGALLAACFWIIRPFLPALIWASMIAVATWPLLLILEDKIGGRRSAVILMLGLLILVFVIPFSLAVGTIVENAPQITALGKQATTVKLPTPPNWLEEVPIIGSPLADYWRQATESDTKDITQRLAPYLRNIAGWLVSQAGSFGMMFIHFLLTLILTAMLYMNGEGAAEMVLRLARRIARERGENAVILTASSVRAVAQGVVVTALIQSLLAGVGLAVVGIPYASLQTALIFMLTIAQIGPGPVLITVVIWLFWKGSLGWAIALMVWSIFVMSMDGILRPVLIRRNADLPLLLIFAGVIGGLIGFGVIGLFIGPVLLTVCYTLMKAWVNGDTLQDQISTSARED